ncbi:MAG: prepilin-type N-terminal cleavage/methylation domain-containing protein [Candidatus Omnitrophica bacterium]|nr:prepilin-type N-terminal cleavage/methylation domain-containing protein [Candidatus Omnitrophota bacterium]
MRLPSNQLGFTLIEIMVSILLLAITLTGGMVLYHNAEQIMALMVHKKVAMELADEKMEEVRNTKYVLLTVGEATESSLAITGLPASRKTVVSEPASNLKEVRVEVNWNEAGAGAAKSVELVSYVAK